MGTAGNYNQAVGEESGIQWEEETNGGITGGTITAKA